MNITESDFNPHLLAIVATGGLAVVGIAFNLLLLRVLWRMGELWGSFPSRLATCVAGGDIFAALSLLSFGGYRYVYIYSGWVGYIYCSTFSFGLLFFLDMSGLAVATIALDRYRSASHQTRLRPRRAAYVLGGVALVYAAILALNASLDFFKKDILLSFCLPGGYLGPRMVDLFESLLVGGTVLLLCACFIGIYVHQRAHQRVRCDSKPSPEGKLPAHAVIWLVAYLLCHLPKVVMAVWGLRLESVSPMDLGGALVIGFGCAVMTNPLLVMFLHPQVYQEARATLFPRAKEPIGEL